MQYQAVSYECGGCGAPLDVEAVEKSPDRIVKCPFCRKKSRFEPKPQVAPAPNSAAAYDPFAMPNQAAAAAAPQGGSAGHAAAPAGQAMFVPGAKVANEVRQSVRFFKEKQFDTAVKYAEDVLTHVLDHATSLFILGYVRAFVNKERNRDALERFFYETLPEIEMTGEELESFKECVMLVRPNLIKYHESIITAVVKNHKKGGAEFVETFSPAIINSYTDIKWATAGIFETFKEAGKHGSMPKTWYALYQGALQNPASPLKDPDNWDYEDMVKKFYENYVLRMDVVFSNIQDDTLRAKFHGGSTKVKNVFISKMN